MSDVNAFIVRDTNGKIRLYKFEDTRDLNGNFYELDSDFRPKSEFLDTHVEYVHVDFEFDYSNTDGVFELTSIGTIQMSIPIYESLISDNEHDATMVYMAIEKFADVMGEDSE